MRDGSAFDPLVHFVADSAPNKHGNERANLRFGGNGRHSLKAPSISAGGRAVRGTQPHPRVRESLVPELNGQHLREVRAG